MKFPLEIFDAMRPTYGKTESLMLLSFSDSPSGDNEGNKTMQFAPVNGTAQQKKKQRLKRRERDQLRSTIVPLYDQESPGRWETVRAAFSCAAVTRVLAVLLLVLILLFFLALYGVTVRQDVKTEKMQKKINEVEARSSELPARFHEAHVRLQELQRNTSALWEAVQSFRDSLQVHKNKVDKLNAEVSSLQSSVQASPLLSSVPKDVQALQSSVASFGSTLQDLQSAVRGLKTQQKTVQSDLGDIRVSVGNLENSTTLPTEKDGSVVSVSAAVSEVQRRLEQLDLTETNSLHNISAWKIEVQDNIKSLKDQQSSQEVLLNKLSDDLELHSTSTLSSDVITSLARDVKNISTQLHDVIRVNDALADLSQNVSVVKGVEKKLEGSQLQLASSVSSLKQQLLSLQHSVSALTPVSTTTSAPDNLSATTAQGQHSRRRKSVRESDEESFVSVDGMSFTPGNEINPFVLDEPYVSYHEIRPIGTNEIPLNPIEEMSPIQADNIIVEAESNDDENLYGGGSLNSNNLIELQPIELRSDYIGLKESEEADVEEDTGVARNNPAVESSSLEIGSSSPSTEPTVWRSRYSSEHTNAGYMNAGNSGLKYSRQATNKREAGPSRQL